MAFQFDATEGGASANSYCTVEFADDYFGGELYCDEWLDADSADKQKALVKATRRLDRLEWVNIQSFSSQRLRHPRYMLENDHGFYYPTDSIIEPVKQACCLLALYYLQQNPAETVDESLRQFKSLHIAGVLNLEMRDSLPDRDDIPSEVVNLISPWLAAGPGGVRLIRA